MSTWGILHIQLLSLSAASGGSWGQGSDAVKDLSEQLPGYRHLRHLEDRPSGMAYDPRTYLDQFELHAPERPVGYLNRKGEATQEVTEVICQDEEGQPHLVGDEAAAGEARPGQGILAFFDVLLTEPSLIVEADNAFRFGAQVGDDESDAGKSSP